MSINVGSAIAYLDLNTTKFVSGLKDAQAQASGLDNSTKTLHSSLSTTSRKLTAVGGSITRNLSAPLAIAGGAIIKVSADFEKGLSKLKAISGATAEQMDMLKQKSLELGAKTSFSASQSTDAFTYMAQAGWKVEDMLNGVEGVMNLAAASGEDLALTASIVTDSLTGFGLTSKDTAMFVDALAMAANASNTDVAMMGESFKYVAPVAGALGMSAQDTAIALGLMANAGIKSSQSGTALRTMLTNLVKPTDAMAVAMKKYNISVTNADGTVKPLKQLMDELRTTFGNLTEAEKAKLAATLAGKEGMSGMLAIVNASSKSYDQLADSIYNSTGTAEEMAKTMLDNLAGQWEQFKGAMETFAIQMGDALMPIIKGVVKVMQAVADGMTKIPKPIKTVIAVVGSLLVAAGPLIMLAGGILGSGAKIIELAPKVGTAIKTAMGFMTGPVGIAIVVIAGLVAAFVHLYKTNEKFKAAVDKAWGGIKRIFSDTFGKLKEHFEKFGETLGKLKTNLEPVFKILGLIAGVVITNIIAQISALFAMLGPLLDGVGYVIEYITNIVKMIIALFQGDFSKAGEYARAALEAAKNAILSVFQAIWEGIKAFFKTFLTILGSVFGPEFIAKVTVALTWLKGLPARMWESLKASIQKAKDWASGLGTAAKNGASAIISNITSGLSSLPTKMKNIGINMIKGLWNGIKSVEDWIWNKIKDFFDNGIVGKVMKLLGINSPSRVFERKIGLNMGLGAGVGFVKSMKAVQSTMGKKLKEVVDVSTKTAQKAWESSGMSNLDVGFADKSSFEFSPNPNKPRGGGGGTQALGGSDASGQGDTFIFNTPRQLSAYELALAAKRAKRDRLLGF